MLLGRDEWRTRLNANNNFFLKPSEPIHITICSPFNSECLMHIIHIMTCYCKYLLKRSSCLKTDIDDVIHHTEYWTCSAILWCHNNKIYIKIEHYFKFKKIYFNINTWLKIVKYKPNRILKFVNMLKHFAIH